MINVTRTEYLEGSSSGRRAAAVLGAVAFMAATVPVFWNLPGNDSHGEGPGHALAHLTWAGVLLVLATWLWRQRASFTSGTGPRLAVIALFVGVGAQGLESVGAVVVWATGKHAHGNFAVHDVAAASGNSIFMLLLATGLVACAVAAVRRKVGTKGVWTGAAVLLAGFGLIALAACGGDESSSKQAYCDVERRIRKIIGEEFAKGGSSASPDQLGGAAVSASKRIVSAGLPDEALRKAPAEVRNDVVALVSAVRTAADGNPSAFLSDASQAATHRIGRYCGFDEE